MAKAHQGGYRRFIRIGGILVGSPWFEKKKDADEWSAQMLRRKQFFKHGLSGPDEDSITVIEWSREWLKKRMERYPKATWYSDEQRLRDYVLPMISEIPLNMLTQVQIKKVLESVITQGRSQQTRNRVRALMSAMLFDAMDAGHLKLNPAAGIRFRDARESVPAPVYLEDKDEIFHFLRTAKSIGPTHFIYACLALMSGLRKSEMLALRFLDCQLSEKYLRIVQILEQASLTIVRRTKKGKNARRDVPIPDNLVLVLKAAKKEADKLGYEYVLHDSKGHFLRPRDLSRIHAEIVGATKRHVTIHGLRHTYARQFAINSGNLKALQMILGHSSPMTTAIYSELSAGQVKQFGNVVTFSTQSDDEE